MMEQRGLEPFQRERPLLMRLAYRMLGSIADAEDVLQDAFLRWDRTSKGGAAVENPPAYLVRLVTRLCLDALGSAHARRIEYVGPWLPEPLVRQASEVEADDPFESHAMIDDLSIAFLLMLERLGPVERAVVLLRESFGFSYAEIALIVGKSEQNCRQIDRRAHVRLKDAGRVSKPVDPEAHERLLQAFLRAARLGDLEGLLAILSEDAVSLSDGGGKVVAARRPITGAREVARFFIGGFAKAPEGMELRPAVVNGTPGIVTYIGGQVHNVTTIHVVDGRIRNVFIIVNPDKLTGVRNVSAPAPRR